MEKNYFWFLYILGVGYRTWWGEGDGGMEAGYYSGGTGTTVGGEWVWERGRILQQPHPCKYSGCTPMCMGVSPPPKKHKYF